MQLNAKEIYEKASESSGIPVDKIKLVGNAVFKEWNTRLKYPTSIILKIKQLGTHYIRKAKAEEFVNRLVKKREEWSHKLTEESFENNEKQIELFSAQLVEYEKYIYKKRQIRKIRNENQELIKPDIQQEEIPKTSFFS